MYIKQLGLALAIIVPSIGFTPISSAEVNTGQVTGFKTIESGWAIEIQPGTSRSYFSTCAAGEAIVAGGFRTQGLPGQNNPANGFHMIHSYPENDRTWNFKFKNTDNVARKVKIYRICAG